MGEKKKTKKEGSQTIRISIRNMLHQSLMCVDILRSCPRSSRVAHCRMSSGVGQERHNRRREDNACVKKAARIIDVCKFFLRRVWSKSKIKFSCCKAVFMTRLGQMGIV